MVLVVLLLSLVARKRRGLKDAASGPQTGEEWISAPGMSRTESFFRKYRFARRVSSVTQRWVEARVR